MRGRELTQVVRIVHWCSVSPASDMSTLNGGFKGSPQTSDEPVTVGLTRRGGLASARKDQSRT